MKLWLRREDIEKGRMAAAGACPVALALRRHSGGRDWHVDQLVAGADGNLGWFLGQDAREFVQRFDGGWQVKPGYVHLYRVPPLQRTR